MVLGADEGPPPRHVHPSPAALVPPVLPGTPTEADRRMGEEAPPPLLLIVTHLALALPGAHPAAAAATPTAAATATAVPPATTAATVVLKEVLALLKNLKQERIKISELKDKLFTLYFK